MKFQDALTHAVDYEKKKEKNEGITFKGIEPKTLKLLSLFWNMIAVSGKTLDDLVYIDNNTNIVSVPIENKEKVKEKNKDKDKKISTGKKPKSSKKKAAAVVDDNGKEKEKEE